MDRDRFTVARAFCWIFLFLCLGSLSGALVWSRARKPSPSPDPSERLQTKAIKWVRDGRPEKFQIVVHAGRDHMSVNQLAQLSEAQLRWQAVTKQACLSRRQKLLCFNWKTSRIASNQGGESLKYKLVYTQRKLLVPVRFAESKLFEDFSETKIKYEARRKVLTQSSPVNLALPPVENLGDRYRLTLPVPSQSVYRVVAWTRGKIWLRFVQGRFSGSHDFAGDDFIKEIKVIQRRRSADLRIALGPKATSSDIYFDGTNHNLVIEVFTSDRARSHRRGGAGDVALLGRGKSLRRRNSRLASPKAFRTIVIDPGHGGEDSGALGVRRTMEKNINLKLSKALVRELKKNKNMRVVLTRSDDRFLPLSERTEIANRVEANLFVSIHCNSSISAKSTGFEVYILASEATDEAAAAVARLENSVVAMEKGQGRNSTLTNLLASMAVNNFINESSKCAGHICRGVKRNSSVKKTSVKEADFHVLKGSQMPSVLVEAGYLSNPLGETRLRSKRYRAKLAKGIAKGIVEFDRDYRKTPKTLAGAPRE